eukprot:1191985-Prorocentrum_minimum.AAC.1
MGGFMFTRLRLHPRRAPKGPAEAPEAPTCGRRETAQERRGVSTPEGGIGNLFCRATNRLC